MFSSYSSRYTVYGFYPFKNIICSLCINALEFIARIFIDWDEIKIINIYKSFIEKPSGIMQHSDKMFIMGTPM